MVKLSEGETSHRLTECLLKNDNNNLSVEDGVDLVPFLDWLSSVHVANLCHHSKWRISTILQHHHLLNWLATDSLQD